MFSTAKLASSEQLFYEVHVSPMLFAKSKTVIILLFSITHLAEISREGDIAEEEPEKPSQVVLTKRHQIAAELQQTERNYVDTLTTLIKVRHLRFPL